MKRPEPTEYSFPLSSSVRNHYLKRIKIFKKMSSLSLTQNFELKSLLRIILLDRHATIYLDNGKSHSYESVKISYRDLKNSEQIKKIDEGTYEPSDEEILNNILNKMESLSLTLS